MGDSDGIGGVSRRSPGNNSGVDWEVSPRGAALASPYRRKAERQNGRKAEQQRVVPRGASEDQGVHYLKWWFGMRGTMEPWGEAWQ